jgi:hypothetical protein
MRLLGFVICLCIATSALSQGNALHWKNRTPVKGYWQQDVSYEIKASLNDETDLISGEMSLVYTNNSPDELTQLYFHVYQNMFEPNSYKNQFAGKADGKQEEWQKTDVTKMRINGKEVPFKKDNTVLIVDLSEPILPGSSAQIDCSFSTQFGAQGGRMKVYTNNGHKHFNVVHWYPRISVYDRKFGWTTDQHLGHEFYGDFGTYEVEISLPEHYILDGTGKLLNRAEVLPESLMEKVRIENFADKPWGEKPSEVVPVSSKPKTWKFKAENVHDFAWTADPTYRIGLAKAKLEDGSVVDCYSLAQEQHASGWQNAAAYTASVIELYSKDFGSYAYPKMIVADARDGMEYPMLTLDGGRDPHYRDLIAHEVGHNWFFGMVGNNETYRASLDEGFTQFLTSWAMEHLEGDTINWTTSSSKIQEMFKDERGTRDAQIFHGYYRAALMNNSDPNLNTHSDHFKDRTGYGQVYYKTATMLYNLQYVLGDSLFLESMQHYFNQWKFCHPYFNDFRSSIIQFTGVDLNWFFDQWLESGSDIDYGIQSFKRRDEGSYEIEIVRKGEMQMPIALTVTTKDGDQLEYWIPNTYFVKSNSNNVLPQWVGWGDNNTVYRAQIASVTEVKTVQIDASNRLADVYHLDNKIPFPIDVQFDDLNYSYPIRAYAVEWHPSLWYNGYDGLKIGVEAKGDYFHTHHKIDVGFWFNTGLLQQTNSLHDISTESDFYRFNYRLDYQTPLRGIAKNLDVIVSTRFMDGVAINKVGWQKKFANRKTKISQSIWSLYRPDQKSLNYAIIPGQWGVEAFNNFLQTELEHRYRYGKRSQGLVRSNLRNNFLGSDYNYGFVNLSSVNENRTKKLNLRTRVFAQVGFGSDWAPESQLLAAGANPEEMQSNPFIRSAGFIPATAGGYGIETGWFNSGGGLNLRGYSGYLMPELNEDSLVRFAYAGTTGLAVNTELEFDDLIRILPGFKRWVEVKTYLFADAGLIDLMADSYQLSGLRADAGVGMALDIKQWGQWSDLQPTTIRVDFPLFLNRPPSNQEFFQFRWILAIDRAF